jgi:hypothetical protein
LASAVYDRNAPIKGLLDLCTVPMAARSKSLIATDSVAAGLLYDVGIANSFEGFGGLERFVLKLSLGQIFRVKKPVVIEAFVKKVS